MTAWLEARPDQTAQELLIEFQARYPGRYADRQMYTLQRYVLKWCKQEIQRSTCDVGSNSGMLNSYAPGNKSSEAIGNEVT